MTTDVSTNKLKINVLTRIQYDSAEKNNGELYFVEESETNTWLIAVTDVAPATASANDRYYNQNTKLIYTWNGTTWTNAISPTPDDLYINKENNSTYAWDGNDLIQIGSTGGITTDDIDGQTITLNSSDKIQASGVINKNDGAAKYDWVGTKNEYDALEEIHNDWIYYITDDEYPSGNMSFSNIYNRLNRAYAWTYKHVNGAGNVYGIYYNNGFYSTDAYPATDIVGNESSKYMTYGSANYIICDGKLYYFTQSGNTVTRIQVGSDDTWTAISGGWYSNNHTLAINNGDLYYIYTTSVTLRDTGGWQKISNTYSTSYPGIGIKNDSLYLVNNYGNVRTLIDSSGVWSDITGMFMNSTCYTFGIKDGKLYSISSAGNVTEISSDNTWTMISGYDESPTSKNVGGLGINNGALYWIKYDGVYLANDTETWVKCSGGNSGWALTSTGKLYKITRNNSGTISLTQIGTDTTWSDITCYDSAGFGINNGNVYYNLNSTPTQLTTSGGITKVVGMLYQNNNYGPCGFYWTGSVTEDVHTVYTIPSPQTGFHTYADENLSVVSTITAVNMNNNTITDGLYTYTRDGAADKIFTAVSPDSKNQLISMADLLNAIKG